MLVPPFDPTADLDALKDLPPPPQQEESIAILRARQLFEKEMYLLRDAQKASDQLISTLKQLLDAQDARIRELEAQNEKLLAEQRPMNIFEFMSHPAFPAALDAICKTAKDVSTGATQLAFSFGAGFASKRQLIGSSQSG